MQESANTKRGFNKSRNNNSRGFNSKGGKPQGRSSSNNREGRPSGNNREGRPYNNNREGRPFNNNRDRDRNRGNGRNRRSGSGKPTAQKISRDRYISAVKPEVVKEQKPEYQGINYRTFELDDRINKNLDTKGFKLTTEIQEKAIPIIIKGEDLLGISPTGSGKTGAFLIPMIDKLLNDRSQKLLVLAPTRELAMQIAKEALSFLKGTHLQIATVIGGDSMSRQISQLRKGGHILVGTPGRILDLKERGAFRPAEYNNVVIDEVDRMLDMGFIKDISKILGSISKERQSLFFSATLNGQISKIVDTLSESYDVIKLAENKPSTSVVQSVVDYSHNEEKIELLEKILEQEEVDKAIIFVETKRFAEKVDKILFGKQFKVGVIHGDKRQSNRNKTIDKFKRSEINVLVATNVAARGIDIDDITHVINLDEPQSYDEYIHRIGRTGRNGAKGIAYTFVKRG